MLAGSLLRLGLALQLAGDWDGATAALERVLALSRETHEVYEAAYALAALGEMRLAQGEREAGCQALAENYGQWAYACGSFTPNTFGEAQTSIFVLRAETSEAHPQAIS